MSRATQSEPAFDARALVEAISSVVGGAKRPVALHEPLFKGNEKTYVASCIDEGWVSSVGSFVDRFERELAQYCGARYACVVVNGTAALHMALTASGLQPGEEVLIPSLTFVATANAVLHAGGVPHFVEVENESLGIDPEALDAYLKKIVVQKEGYAVNRNTQQRIRALMPVHVFGHPCRVDALTRIAESYGLDFIEDATEALGSEYRGGRVGRTNTAVLSFNGNKIVTTGGGGAVLTSDEMLYKKIKHLTTTAKKPHKWEFQHDEMAWNYRLPNINAALGCAQLEQLPGFVKAKRALAARYMQALDHVRGVHVIAEPKETKSNYWLVSVRLEQADQLLLNNTLARLHDAELLCRPVWTPLHLLSMYDDAPRMDLARTEHLAKSIISLPSSVALGLAYV